MDYYRVVLLVFALGYFDIKKDIKKILTYQSKTEKKDFTLLEKLKGKEIQIEIDDDDIISFDNTKKGILKDFNDAWLILETEDKKGKKTLYYRMINIKGVVEVK